MTEKTSSNTLQHPSPRNKKHMFYFFYLFFLVRKKPPLFWSKKPSPVAGTCQQGVAVPRHVQGIAREVQAAEPTHGRRAAAGVPNQHAPGTEQRSSTRFGRFGRWVGTSKFPVK